eukprot:14180203-Alexandrium_andersonii.AAC.1
MSGLPPWWARPRGHWHGRKRKCAFPESSKLGRLQAWPELKEGGMHDFPGLVRPRRHHGQASKGTAEAK